MMAYRLRVTPAIFERYSEFRALIVYVSGIHTPESNEESLELQQRVAEEQRRAFDGAKASSHPHIAAWRQAYSAFGVKPSRFPCSAEALLKRVLRGDALPRINYLVDVYNALSVRYVLPLGGEDRDRLTSDLVLDFATGKEVFLTRGDGTVEHPEPGEVVWADSSGVTCRCWNWRQGERTALTSETENAYFLFETLKPFPLEKLQMAYEEFKDHLRKISTSCRVESELIEA